MEGFTLSQTSAGNLRPKALFTYQQSALLL